MFNEIFDMEKIYYFVSALWCFFALNILFLASNFPLVVFFVGFGISGIEENLTLFLLSCILLGASLSAIMHCINKFTVNKGIYPFKEYIKGYKSNFLQSTSIAAIQIVGIFILLINIRFFSSLDENLFFSFFSVIFSILFVILILITPDLYMLVMKFKMQTLEIFKTAITICLGKPVLTLGNTAAFLFTLMLFEIQPGTVLLLMSSIYAYLVLCINRGLLKDLEKNQKDEAIEA